MTKKGDSRTIMYGEWSMLFGKYKAKIFEHNERLLFSIKKKVNVWKLKVNYFIKDKNGKSFEINGKNKKHSIYELKTQENMFELKLHSGNKKSFFKNGIQIASIDETVFKGKTTIKTKSIESLPELFLMLFCLKIGEDNDGITLNFGNISRMEPINENWKP
ncbi:hypothetical protein Q4587_16400 [Polaribacter sp. 1_MG-2023]|nr:hypothetical protein [Polaribacter sp. 1_MG-2023]